MNYQEKLNQDLVGQFRAKPRLETLLAALARQLQEVWQTYQDLRDKRNLEQATGQQLDGIGDIVALSRIEAAKLLRSVGSGSAALNDEKYRTLLQRKILLNSSSCTYYQLVNSLQTLCPGITIYYSEDPAFPATLTFSFDALDEEGDPVDFGEIPLIHPAGVATRYDFRLSKLKYLQTEISCFTSEPLLCGTVEAGEKFCGNKRGVN